ncbi:MAG: anaerobic sulfatase maturase [Lentisphaeria bacterium]
MKKLSSVLVKPSGADCNLRCEYCFYLDKKELFGKEHLSRMSNEVLEELIKQAMDQSGDEVVFTWQGGEPTLMGLDFYKKVIEFEHRYGSGKVVGNGFQTNGLLLDEQWANFLGENQFLVGLSLDGPQHIHDYYRLRADGSGSWEKVYKNVRMLLQKGVEVNALSCVTSYSWKYAREIYDFHKNLGIKWMQFIPVVERDKKDGSKAADFSVTAEQYGHFLCEMFDLWQRDFNASGLPTTSVRHFDSIFYRYVGYDAPECTMQKQCGPYVVVEHNGNIYGCDFFVDEAGYLGNIMKGQTLIGALNSKRQNQFGKLKSMYPKGCKDCQWLSYCYGGCLKDRIKDPKDQGENHFCLAYKMFFNHADERLREMAYNWKRENGVRI